MTKSEDKKSERKLGWKIKILRTRLGLTQKEFGEKVGVPQSTVHKWENSAQNPRINTLKKLADLAGETYLQFIGKEMVPIDGVPSRRIQVITSLQAGEWRETPEWDPSDRYEVLISLPSNFDNLPLHAAVVRGESMNVFYPDGSIVFITPLENYPGGLKSGMHVAAVNHDHGSYEVTLKEYIIDEKGEKWLVPRSTSLEHQQPVKFDKRNNMVQIVGVVVYAQISAPGANLVR